MKTIALLMCALSGIYSAHSKINANVYYVTVVPNGLKVVPGYAAPCGLGDDLPCQISVNGTYAVGATIPPSVQYTTLNRRAQWYSK